MDLPPPPARFESAERPRPALRWIDVTTTLRDFAIVTYAADPEKLAGLLAPGFTPEVRTLGDGRHVAFVSAVPFRDRDFRFMGLPWVRFHMGQTNYRAYVWHGGRRAVWFFGTSLTRPHVYAPVVWWKLPWHPARMWFDSDWDGERCRRYTLRTESSWAPIELDLEGSDQPVGVVDGFVDEEDTLVTLTHPLDGYYFRRDGRVGSYSIWHDRLRLQRGVAHHARIHLFERLGLISAHDAPHSVLLQREAEFLIKLPPRPLI